MSDILDPRLKYLQSKGKRELEVMDTEGMFGLQVERVERRIEPSVKVFVQYDGDVEVLRNTGLEVRTVAGDVVTGVIHMNDVEALSAVEGVVRIESSRPMARELDVSISEIRADQVHAGPPGYRGSGVIIGIIDSGIDFTHGAFRQPAGQTRILAIWDQALTPQGSESNPTGYSYGVEYSRADIDSALSSVDPFSVVRHRDSNSDVGHGTHVAGIAAGDGSAAPTNTFVGVAPEAQIIMVRNQVTDQAFGDSSQTLDAVAYILRKAALLDMPVVINLSQGDNIGPHDGTSILERGIDNLLGSSGQIMVKSAGNEGVRNRHAMGTVPAGGSEDIGLSAVSNDNFDNVIDIWYDGADRFGFRITPPGGAASAVVNPGSTTSFNLPNGNMVFVASALNDANNGDNRIYVTVGRGTAATIQNGLWTITLTGQTVVNGNFHAWIERSNEPTFTFRLPHRTNSHTISIPGTSREVIAVGSYISKGTGAGNLSSFSSRGPTRDGLQKPEISAPGQVISSARAAGILNGSGNYHTIWGTSMAAPHVAGVIALMLEKNPNLTQQQVRDCLMNNARSDAFTGVLPNNDWGAGKVDAVAAVNCIQVSTIFKFFDDQPTTIFKFLDDGSGTIKAIDDIQTPNKFADDFGTPNKFADDVSTANKFQDDGGTPLKVIDDGGTAFKFLDDGPGTIKAIDDVKQPALDKQPLSDRQVNPFGRRPFPASGQSETAPFVMSTPHHSTAWMQNMAPAFQQELARYQQAVQQYEAAMAAFKERVEAGRLTAEEQAQLVQLDQEYRALLAELEQVLQAAGLV